MISIIVPVYNVEKYLNQCIESILMQTYKDFELILVDDGSTDKSGLLCDQYKDRDYRIKVIHKENGGLSDARNKGTKEAKGTYVTYIDSDDYVREDYLEVLVKLADLYSADIVVTGIQCFFDGDVPKSILSEKEPKCYDGIEALSNVLYQKDMDTSACAMLLSRKIALNHFFPYGKYHEDDFTTFKYYLDADRVAVSYEKQYFYRQRRESIMSTVGKPIYDEKEASDRLVEDIQRLEPKLLAAAKSKKFSNYCQIYLKLATCNEKEDNFESSIEKYLKDYCKYIVADRNVRNKNRLAGMMIMFFGTKGFRYIGNMRRKV